MFLNIDGIARDRIALKDDSGLAVTYGDLADFCADLEGKKLSRSVAFCLCENAVGCMAAVIGCETVKVVPLLLNCQMDRALLRDLEETYTPCYYIVPEAMKAEFPGEEVFRAFGYCYIKTAYPPYPINERLSLLLTTSGSTGSPKLVRYKYGNLEANAKNVAKVFSWRDSEIGMCDLPIQYTMGLNVINSHLAVGAAAYLTKYNLMSAEFWDALKRERCTDFCGVPFSYEVFFKLRFQRMDLPDLYTLAEGGGRLTDARFQALAAYAEEKGKRFCATFGTTETSARMSFLPPELAKVKTGSIGRAIPEGELFLLDDDGREIAEMEAEGEMGYRGPNVTMGYGLCREDLMKGDEWQGEYHTGDIAKRDADGCYYIVGRRNRFLKLFGLRVSLDRCELFIKSEFDTDCACAGTDDRMEIYITNAAVRDEIIPFISKKTNLQRTAFRVNVIPEIPKSDSGKVKYSELR